MTEPIVGTLVANMAGISYRQLDYLVRSGAVDIPQEGQGKHRRWTPDQVHRLQVAAALNQVLIDGVPRSSRASSGLPYITAAVFSGPSPTGNWVVLRSGDVSYGATLAALFPKGSAGAIVTEVPELWP